MSIAKTSQSHPLRIAQVGIRDGRGVIGLTFCPGKKHTGMISGAWDRDLCIDMKAIEDFGATVLVTLMEDAELDAVHVPPDCLRAEALEHGIEWHYLPVADVDIPDRRFEDMWTYSGLRLRNILKCGGKVVVLSGVNYSFRSTTTIIPDSCWNLVLSSLCWDGVVAGRAGA
jgi:ADP-ribosyl-[dinitrogen reductase] hydrolase